MNPTSSGQPVADDRGRGLIDCNSRVSFFSSISPHPCTDRSHVKFPWTRLGAYHPVYYCNNYYRMVTYIKHTYRDSRQFNYYYRHRKKQQSAMTKPTPCGADLEICIDFYRTAYYYITLIKSKWPPRFRPDVIILIRFFFRFTLIYRLRNCWAKKKNIVTTYRYLDKLSG